MDKISLTGKKLYTTHENFRCCFTYGIQNDSPTKGSMDFHFRVLEMQNMRFRSRGFISFCKLFVIIVQKSLGNFNDYRENRKFSTKHSKGFEKIDFACEIARKKQRSRCNCKISKRFIIFWG